MTETCDKNNKTQFITDVGVTPATTADVKELSAIRERLEEGKMKPEEHYGDAGFVNGQTIEDSHDKGIVLVHFDASVCKECKVNKRCPVKIGVGGGNLDDR